MFELLLLGKKVGNNGQIYTGPSLCIFAGGANSGTTTTFKITDKYFLKDDTVSSGTMLIVERRETSGAGNLSEGFVFGGASSVTTIASTERYVYSTDVVSASTNMLYGLWGTAATGNADMAIITGGYNTSASQKFVYSTKTMLATTNLDSAVYRHCASSNVETGFFFKTGSSRASIRRYNYSSATITSGVELSLAGEGPAAAGTTNYAVISSAYNATNWTGTEKYNYGANTKATGTKLNTGRIYLCAAGDKQKSIFGLGQSKAGSIVNLTEGYYFSNDSVAPGTSLSVARYGAASLSAPPGWVV
ncbi:MAG: hypothetical protein PHQ58_05150 [Rhodoferax sp.]|uniref:hypothetical protein n=1 Tax=Rhodoferax sp. TaxID=50421 RepID=UPI0026058798|nr:hypothetical protein [Rhodoferax sp.]MDD2879802.1 hypothetical protein [Rhodoferax sp.]